MAARTLLTVLPVVRTSLRPTPAPATAADVANGNVCANDGCTWLEFTNTDGGATHTVTVSVPAGVDGLAAGPRTYTLPISALAQKAGIFPIQFYGNTLLINADSALVKINVFTAIGP